MKKNKILNQRGALTIVNLMFLSSLFIVMMGVAGVKLFEAAKKASEAQEAYNYLIVMEEMGQAIQRARTLGRDAVDCFINPVAPAATVADGTCPAGTVAMTSVTGAVITTRCPGHPTVARQNRNQYTLCIPNTDGDGVAEATDFCVTIDGFNYCLQAAGLNRLDLAAETDQGRPFPYIHIPTGSLSESTPGGTLEPRNTQERWSPSVTWTNANNNQIFTTSCGVYGVATNSRYWLGCQYCENPQNECWEMRMCRPSATATPVACAAGETANQRILFYFENNLRN